MTDLVRLYLSGEVRRYHANPAVARFGQTDADHHGRCVQLLLVLNPAASPALIRAVALHDVGELVSGDLSLDFKQRCPEFAAQHAQFETVARETICGPDPVLTQDDCAWAKLVDRLEAHAYCLVYAPDEYRRPRAGWIEAETGLLARADALGCGIAVRGMLHDLKGGCW